MKLILIVSGAAVALAGAAFANHHESKDGDAAMNWEAKTEAHFKEVDANANGQVTEAELVAYMTAKAKKEFAEMAGTDGLVTLDEAKAHHKAKHDAMMKEDAMMKDDAAKKL
ncbi:MAG: hypothetical protein ACKVS5_12155 [Parvularculaceae bacterium]